MIRPTSTKDLSPSERTFLAAMQQLNYGRYEYLQIRDGELVLDPPPVCVRGVKFGSVDRAAEKKFSMDFELKTQTAEFFEYIREVEVGEIRTLEVKNGLPFSMEIETAGGRRNG